MPSYQEVVNTTIDIKDAAVSQDGFGTSMVVAYHTFWADRIKTFSDPNDLLVAPYNVPSTHPVYTLAVAAKRQKPSPSVVKIGQRKGAATQTVLVTPVNPVQGDVFQVQINGITYSATAGASPTVTTVATSLASAITGAAGLTAVGGATGVTITSSVTGTRHRIEPLTSNLTLKESTVNPTTGIEVDLANIRALDSDWYGLLIDSSGAAEVLAAAAWAENQKVIFMPTIADTEAGNAAITNDLATQLRVAGYQRTVPLYHTKPISQGPAAAWQGRMLAKAPGSANWANMSLAGVDKLTLDDSFRAALKGKNVNYYIDVKGVGFTLDGRASGGRFADITHGNDWFESRLQERMIGMLANNDKVAFTDKGLQLIQAQIEAQILEGIRAEVIDGDQPWSATVPKLANVSSGDRIARQLTGAKFQFVLQGAVNKVLINGTVLIAPN